MEEDSVLVESPCGGVGETNTPIPSQLRSHLLVIVLRGR